MGTSKFVVVLGMVVAVLLFLFVPWLIGEALRYVTACFRGELNDPDFKSMWLLGISWLIILSPFGSILFKQRG